MIDTVCPWKQAQLFCSSYSSNYYCPWTTQHISFCSCRNSVIREAIETDGWLSVPICFWPWAAQLLPIIHQDTDLPCITEMSSEQLDVMMGGVGTVGYPFLIFSTRASTSYLVLFSYLFSQGSKWSCWYLIGQSIVAGARLLRVKNRQQRYK